MKQLLIGLASVIVLCGCGKEQEKLSGGKPLAYWLEEMKKPDAKLRQKAVFKLGNVGAADPAVLPAVLGALSDQDPAVRCEAILAVLRFRDRAQAVETKLIALQQIDPDAKVRDFAAKAIEKLKERP